MLSINTTKIPYFDTVDQQAFTEKSPVVILKGRARISKKKSARNG